MKSLKLYLIVATILLAIYIIAVANQPKNVDWSESFNDKEKKPFGTYILYNRLGDIFPGARIVPFHQPVYSVIADDSIKNATYIIVCGYFEPTKEDYEQITKYIKQGNDIFIASAYFGKTFEKFLKVKTLTELKLGDNGSPVNFTSPFLISPSPYKINKGAGNVYFDGFDTLKATVIGENIMHKANIIKYAYGQGSLYLASNPKLFSNYSLLNKEGLRYAATALSYLKRTNQVVWDEYYTRAADEDDSPMRVFFSKPALQWAYYITIFSLITFVIYDIKRRQRIIPVIEPLANSTLDFVNVVGQVYYEKRDNTNIAHKKILYFLVQLRDEYQIKTNKLDDELVEKLKSKLGIEASLATEFVNYVRYISAQERVSDHELIELNKLIEKLYSQSV